MLLAYDLNLWNSDSYMSAVARARGLSVGSTQTLSLAATQVTADRGFETPEPMLFSRIRALLGDSYSTLLKWTQSTNNAVLHEFMNSKIGRCSLRRNSSKLKTMKSDAQWAHSLWRFMSL